MLVFFFMFCEMGSRICVIVLSPKHLLGVWAFDLYLERTRRALSYRFNTRTETQASAQREASFQNTAKKKKKARSREALDSSGLSGRPDSATAKLLPGLLLVVRAYLLLEYESCPSFRKTVVIGTASLLIPPLIVNYNFNLPKKRNVGGSVAESRTKILKGVSYTCVRSMALKHNVYF